MRSTANAVLRGLSSARGAARQYWTLPSDTSRRLDVFSTRKPLPTSQPKWPNPSFPSHQPPKKDGFLRGRARSGKARFVRCPSRRRKNASRASLPGTKDVPMPRDE